MEIIIPEGVAAIFLITADAAGEIQEMMADAGIGTETGTGIGMIPAGEVLHRSLHPEVLADVKKKVHKEARKQEDESPPVTLLVTVQPFGFPVTESAHSKSPSARVRFFLGQIDVLVRTLQQVQSPGLNCYLPISLQNAASTMPKSRMTAHAAQI